LAYRLLSSSTRAFAREAQRTPDYSRFDWLHGYVYARWPYFYIGIGTGEHWLAHSVGPALERLVELFLPQPDNGSSAQAWANSYHGKVMPLEAATQLVTVQEDVDLHDLEQIIPYTHARDIVLQHPDHIVVLECPCRAVRAEPCRPLDVCLIVGEPIASFVAEHLPARARWITQDEAVDILKAENERGHVHHAFFKDAMLGRFYAICNCCACCCGAMQAHQGGTPMLASSGYVARVDPDLCAACETCAQYCQFAAIAVENGTAAVDWGACMGCGVCVAHCTTGALSLVRDLAKGEPLEIQRLMTQAC
jgi:Pyruvate/2-oxoacid:ferredoxin oxidoreductase delta subunit